MNIKDKPVHIALNKERIVVFHEDYVAVFNLNGKYLSRFNFSDDYKNHIPFTAQNTALGPMLSRSNAIDKNSPCWLAISLPSTEGDVALINIGYKTSCIEGSDNIGSSSTDDSSGKPMESFKRWRAACYSWTKGDDYQAVECAGRNMCGGIQPKQIREPMHNIFCGDFS
ncbi:uncharacterized protein MONOS_10312 [Monocercomonoides exilis]|uniref:uncharacterized protein n=1 Tax=Monocercomonoides exilis TaxID=2049356 RepID=UPI00355A5E39|nr:hypothetical protein MONOS_10312 [Monocercomonoides exilis]